MSCRIEQTPKAEAELLALPREVQKKVIRWYELLAENPRRAGTKQLSTRTDLRRVHVGKDHVVLYHLVDKSSTVLILRVAARDQVYKRLPKAPPRQSGG